MDMDWKDESKQICFLWWNIKSLLDLGLICVAHFRRIEDERVKEIKSMRFNGGCEGKQILRESRWFKIGEIEKGIWMVYIL
jgi:hypothetical protein